MTDTLLRDLERLAQQGDLQAMHHWVDLAWRLGLVDFKNPEATHHWVDWAWRSRHPLGQLLRLDWAQDWAPHILPWPRPRGRKYPPGFSDTYYFGDIQIDIGLGKSGGRKSSSHRVKFVCPLCRKTYSVGRLSQHLEKYVPIGGYQLRRFWGQCLYPDFDNWVDPLDVL